MDVLATNRLARALYTDFDAMPRRERNVARYVFLDKGARELFVDWEIAARETVAALHLYAGRHPYDPQFADLIGDLSVRDEDFRHWWDAHDVDQHTHGTKQYRHTLVGDMTLEYESLTFSDDPDQTLILSIAKPESPSAHALGLLASWTNTPGGPTRPAPGNPPRP
jgi:hypothetical protein